jgi:hypothetical protein
MIEDMRKIFEQHKDDIIIKSLNIPKNIMNDLKKEIKTKKFEPKHNLDWPSGIQIIEVPFGDEIIADTNKGIMPLSKLR